MLQLLMSDCQIKRVRREGIDVTDTPLDFTTDIDGIEIELTQPLTTVCRRGLARQYERIDNGLASATSRG